MKDGFKVADCDIHVQEPADLWERYIEPKFLDRAPRGVNAFSRDATVEMDGRRIPQQSPTSRKALRETQNAQVDERYAFAEARAYDAKSQLEALDREGVDLAVHFPTMGLFTLAVDELDPELGAAIARAYNSWLSDFCSEDPARLKGAAMISVHDVDAAVVESKRAVKELGMVGIFLRPNPIGGKYWHHADYDPLWATLQELNVPVCFHEGGSGCGENPYISQMGEWFDKGMMGHVVSHPFGVMHAVISMCLGGVFERFPQLRAGFMEANMAWVPWLLWRMDEHFEWRGPVEAPELTRMPSDNFKRQGFVVIETDEIPGLEAVRYLDGNNICFSTDYPHGDSKFPDSVNTFMTLEMSEAHRRKILWDNCAQLYALE